jgi:hypothetical protein
MGAQLRRHSIGFDFGAGESEDILHIMRREEFPRGTMRTLASFVLAAFPLFQTATPIDRDTRVKEVMLVKERHKKLLWSLPQVTGVGVGLSKKAAGEVVIMVYLKRELNKKEQKKFPKVLDGVRVETEVSGEFRPRKTLDFIEQETPSYSSRFPPERTGQWPVSHMRIFDL